MGAELRASDVDRERVANELQYHAGAGRLTPDESGERIAHAYHARTLDDLAQLTDDLPRQPPRMPSIDRVDPPVTGMAAFSTVVAMLALLGVGLTPMCG